MRQLMANQSSAGIGVGLILPVPEYDVRTQSEGASIDSPSGGISLDIGVDAHITEINPEARLEKATRGCIERLARHAQRFVNGRWSSGLSQVAQFGTFRLKMHQARLLRLASRATLRHKRKRAAIALHASA